MTHKQEAKRIRKETRRVSAELDKEKTANPTAYRRKERRLRSVRAQLERL